MSDRQTRKKKDAAPEKTDVKLGVRARQKMKTRSDILQAALDTFAERGFEGAAIRDICARAGINHALIKYHFKNKDNLWKEAVRYLFERMDREVYVDPEDEAGLDTEDKFRRLVHRYVNYCARHPEHARIMVQASINRGPRLRWAAENFIRPQHKLALQNFAGFADAGIVPDTSLVLNMYTFAAMCMTTYMLAAEVKTVHGVDVMAPEAIEEHVNTILNIYLKKR